MVHQLTPEAIAAWDQTIRAIAAHLVQRFAYHQDQAPLIDDLAAAGWIALLEHGPEAPHIRCKIRQALLDALARWLWGVTWAQAPRHLTEQLPLEAAADVPSRERSVEERVIEKQTILEIWGLAPPRARQVMALMAKEGQRQLDPHDYEAQGMTKHTVHDERMRLKAAAERVAG
jgi:hypothetical protein